MQKWPLLAILLALLVGATFSVAQQQSSNQAMPTGKAFLKKAAEINLGEVELGKLAEQKGNDPAVKDFGKRMVADHTKAEQELQPLAKQEGVTLPTQPGPAVTTLNQKLSSVSGAEFDQMYMDHMLSGHKGAINTFENEIENGQNPAIKSYAEKVLPVIQDHIRIAEDVGGKMGLAGQQGLDDSYKAITASAKPE